MWTGGRLCVPSIPSGAADAVRPSSYQNREKGKDGARIRAPSAVYPAWIVNSIRAGAKHLLPDDPRTCQGTNA